MVRGAFFKRIALLLRVVRALLFIRWVCVDLVIRSQVQLVFSLLSWLFYSLHCDTLLRLYSLRRGVLFSLIAWVRLRLCCLGKSRIRLTLWCVSVNNCAGVFALMWIPSHVRNELVYERAQQAALEGSIFDRPLSPSDFQSLTRPAFMRAWQTKWDSADTGRFAHSIFPDVAPRPWFEGQKQGRSFVCTVSRVLSGLCSIRSHLGRFRIVEDVMCVCAGDYETVDHLIWHCERFR
jgi:hypothetical protein